MMTILAPCETVLVSPREVVMGRSESPGKERSGDLVFHYRGRFFHLAGDEIPA